VTRADSLVVTVYQPPKLHQHIIMEDTSKAPKSTKVPKAFSDVVPGDVVWAQIVIPTGELVTPEKKPSKNSTLDRIAKGKPVWKYVVVLKRDKTSLIGAASTTFHDSTQISSEKVTDTKIWYPVSPATGDYDPLPSTDGRPAWINISMVHTITEPDPPEIQIIEGCKYTKKAIDLISGKLKEHNVSI